MKNVTVSPTKIVTVTLTDDEWELYSYQESEKVADLLNDELAELLNGGRNRAEVQAAMHDFMAQYSWFGAFDTEPRAVLEEALDAFFGPVASAR